MGDQQRGKPPEKRMELEAEAAPNGAWFRICYEDGQPQGMVIHTDGGIVTECYKIGPPDVLEVVTAQVNHNMWSQFSNNRNGK